MVQVRIHRDIYHQLLSFMGVCHKFTSMVRIAIAKNVVSIHSTDVDTSMLLWSNFPCVTLVDDKGMSMVHVRLDEWLKDSLGLVEGDMMVEIEHLTYLRAQSNEVDYRVSHYEDNVPYELDRCKDFVSTDHLHHTDVLSMSINICIGEAPVCITRKGKVLVCTSIFDIGEISCTIAMDHVHDSCESVRIISKYLYFVASGFVYDTMSIRIHDNDSLQCMLLPSMSTSLVHASFKHQKE